MKKLHILTLLFLSLIVSMSSCKKDENSNHEENIDSKKPFYAKVDGKDFSTEGSAKYVPSTKMLQIIGQTSDSKETIILSLMPFSSGITEAKDWKPGTYDYSTLKFGDLSFAGSSEYNKWNGSGYEQWFADSKFGDAQVTIESNDGKNLKGKFQFEAAFKNSDGSSNFSNTKKITSGQFNVTIN